MSERLHRAIDLAARAHAGQFRKDKDIRIPYVAHVYGVAMLLESHGFSEDVVIAGLLHDVLEDSPAFAVEVATFGDDVHRWVLTVTDPTAGQNNHDWLERKAAYIDRKSTRLNSSHLGISYAVFCLKKKPISVPVASVAPEESLMRYRREDAEVARIPGAQDPLFLNLAPTPDPSTLPLLEVIPI